MHPARRSRRESLPVGLQRALQLVLVDRQVEGVGIAPDPVGSNPDFLVTSADDQVGAAGLTEKAEGPTQGGPGVVLVELGPEQGQKRIATDQFAGLG